MEHASAGETVRACRALVLTHAPVYFVASSAAVQAEGHNPLSEAEKAEICRLRAQLGLPTAEIADRVRRSTSSVKTVLKAAGLLAKRPTKKAA